MRPEIEYASVHAQVTQQRRPGAAPCTVGKRRRRTQSKRTRTTRDAITPFISVAPHMCKHRMQPPQLCPTASLKSRHVNSMSCLVFSVTEGWMGYLLTLLPSPLSPWEFSPHLASPFLLFPSLLYPSIQIAFLYFLALLYLQHTSLILVYSPHLTEPQAPLLCSLSLPLSLC